MSKLIKNQCLLTQQGVRKLKQAIDKVYPDGCNNTELANRSQVHRDTIKKIRDMVDEIDTKPVQCKSLKAVFTSFALDLLEDEDVYTPAASGNAAKLAQKQSITSRKDVLPESCTEKLIEVLWELNYDEQKHSFKQAIKLVKPAATFLIYGEPEQGQKWLVNRLFNQIPYSADALKRPIKIKPHQKDIQSLWQRLAGTVDCSPTPQAIIEQIYNHWQSGTVVLVLYDIDLMVTGQSLQPFLTEFWHPLVERVNQAKLDCPYRLLLFLVDNINAKSKWEKVMLTLEKANPTQPHHPLILQELRPFTWEEGEAWVGIQSKLLLELWPDSSMSDLKIRELMKEIFERNQQSISILKDICDCYDLNWDIDIKGTLAL